MYMYYMNVPASGCKAEDWLVHISIVVACLWYKIDFRLFVDGPIDAVMRRAEISLICNTSHILGPIDLYSPRNAKSNRQYLYDVAGSWYCL